MANNKIQVKRTTTAGRTPNTTSAGNTQYIAAGELALNMTDQIMFTSDGTNLIYVGANQVNQRITNSLTIDNNKALRFTTVNTTSAAYMIQQSDDNFVFYTTDASYAPRPVFSIYANSSTSDFQFGQPVRFNGANVTFNGGMKLYANGSPGAAGEVLTSNSTGVYWAAVSGSGAINVNAQYVWSNLHTFQANATFTGNNISLVSNTGSILFGGSADQNWKIGRNTGATTKFYYTNNTLDIIAADSNLEGFVIGKPGGNTYFETGYAGSFTPNPIYVGNSTVNVYIDSTSFSGTANNASYLGGVAAAAYVQNTFTGTLSGDIVFTGNNSFSQQINVGANVWVSTASFKTGNLTVNAYMNSSLITVQSGASSANITFNAFRTGVSTVNSTLIAVGANVIANTTAISIGANVIANTTTISVGNSTVNTSVIGSSVTVANSTNTATMTPTSVSVGTTVVNTSQIFTAGDLVVQGVATINVNSLAIGNSTANLNANSILLTVANSTSTANLTPADLKIGATTVVNSTQITATTLYAATSANVASVVQANSTGVFIGANVSANNTTFKVGNTTIATTLITLGGQVNANGGVGTAGQVLTSGATGNVYWAAAGGGGSTYMKGGSATVGSLAVEGQNIFRVNANVVSFDVTFVAGENASATGPLTVAAGKTITVEAGARVSIV